MAFEWVAGLFQSDQTRGLSGDSASAVALDDANPYYNYRLRRHLAEGDVVHDPGLLWYTSPYVKQRTGLGTHVGAEVGEGVANYTDVLMILSHEDYARSRKVSGEPWDDVAARTLSQEFDNFCRRENFNRLHVHRQLGFKVLCDGSDEMAGQSLGLQRGEFITGLLPNLYTGPVRGSYPVIGIHVNLPGVWEGYQEVGRLHNDQILFTLGSHWLDNFSHPSLLEAALYRLQQYPDGSFVHIINPDLQDRYQVTSTDQGGASVLTLATRDGQPLAYVVLAVIDPPLAKPSEGGREEQQPAGNRPGIALPKPASEAKSRPPKRDPIPSVAPPMLIDDQLQPVAVQSAGLGGKTIIPDAPSERIFTLQERGALLQKVHFSAFMLGYDVYLGSRGELGTVVESVAATFQVRKRMVSLVAHVAGVTVDGGPLTPGVEHPLDKDVNIEFSGQTLEYRDLRGLRVDGWPYVGEIRRPASSTYMIWGEEYQIGRSRECRVVLPDEPRNENIHWKAKVGDGATIRARTGEIPKSRFYTDSIMVASEHATIDLDKEEPRVVCTARHCHVYVRRDSEVVPLFPSTSGREPQALDIAPGDEVLIGNCLFQVGFTHGEAVAPAPAPKIELSPDSLVDVVDAPNFDNSDPDTGGGPLQAPSVSNAAEDETVLDEKGHEEPSDPFADDPEHEDDGDAKKRRRQRRKESEAPSAHGLGQEGTQPAPVPLQKGEMDSILGDAATVERAEADFGEARHEDEDADAEKIDDEPTLLGTSSFDGLDEPPVRDEVDDADGEEPPPEPEIEEDAEVAEDGDDSDHSDDSDDSDDSDHSDDEAASPSSLDTNRLPDDIDSLSDEDDPTIPGMILPRETIEALKAASEAAREDAPAPPPAPAAIDESEDAGWDEEDWESDTSNIPPSDPGVEAPPADDEEEDERLHTSEVPTPFPELEEGAEDPPEPTSDGPEQVEAPPAEASASQPDAAGRAVHYVDDAEAQFELGRPLHLVMIGWMVNGEVVCGNHSEADMILPESRMVDGQTFQAIDYFKLKIRGRKGKLEIITPTELLIDEDDPTETLYDKPETKIIDVIRRDDAGEEDFAVRIQIVQDRKLPDPRARFVSVDYEDPLAAALITRGLPKGKPRTMDLGSVTATFNYDGDKVVISDYLDTYQTGDGYHPFFVQKGEGRFKTAPEDGSEIELSGGDRVVVGIAVYALVEE